ncbi:MAG: hypothetical protein M3088_01380, partial [Actinomycetota bacterium]|nr:hypothetical protein [Actinomycetota bacterium]
METSQWPLTAASTQILLALPPAGAKGAPAPRPGQALKLGLKELLVRGAFRLQVVPAQWGPAQVFLLPQDPVVLAQSLAALDGWLRPFTPGEIGAVVKAARGYNPRLMQQMGEWFLFELGQRGLVESLEHKRLGLFSSTVYRRTATGDAWANTAAQHVQRLEGLPYEVGVDPSTAARAAAVAGSLALMVPAALASVALLRRRSHRHGGDLEMDFVYLDDAGDGVAFDPFDGVAELFDSAIDGGIDAVDAGAGAVDSALESVA